MNINTGNDNPAGLRTNRTKTISENGGWSILVIDNAGNLVKEFKSEDFATHEDAIDEIVRQKLLTDIEIRSSGDEINPPPSPPETISTDATLAEVIANQNKLLNYLAHMGAIPHPDAPTQDLLNLLR